jgi:type II secretory pathway pseudopilin PulG
VKPTFDNPGPPVGEVSPRADKKTGFTIVELLTVMSIIIILIGLLVPALNRVRRYATRVKQKAQFHSIAVALDLFNAEYEGYPPSGAKDQDDKPYCGAMKLAEAMVGEDLKGFDLNSRFRVADIPTWYPSPAPVPTDHPAYENYVDKLKSRRMYLQLENANAYWLTDIYSSAHLTGVYKPDPCYMVLCDAYVRTMATGNKVGMPILYYKADINKNEHNRTMPAVCGGGHYNIYDRCDNQDLVDIPLPWVSPPGPVHPMATTGSPTLLPGVNSDAGIFYDKTRNAKAPDRPYMADSYILISAGFDGEYGTSDDIFNFGE